MCFCITQNGLCVLYAELDVLDARGNAVHDLLLGRGARRLHFGVLLRLGRRGRVVLPGVFRGCVHSRGAVSHVRRRLHEESLASVAQAWKILVGSHFAPADARPGCAGLMQVDKIAPE
jgi:hypothetical protein